MEKNKNQLKIPLEFEENTPIIDLPSQIDLEISNLPNQYTFPLNIGKDRRIQTVVIEDVKASKFYRIITGYSSLSYIIKFFGTYLKDLDCVEIAFGWSFEEVKRDTYTPSYQSLSAKTIDLLEASLQKEIAEQWQERGFSLLLHGLSIISFIEKIGTKINFRIFRKHHLHAKIYIGETHAILGSANFSDNGMGLRQQAEACIRVGKNSQNELECEYYQGMKNITDFFWENSVCYNEKMKEIYQKSLKAVSWQEALTRAITELLEQNWEKDFKAIENQLNSMNLWPMQKEVINSTLAKIYDLGCVIVAMPTGSGKTKMITATQLILYHQSFSYQKYDTINQITICPPLVQAGWNGERNGLTTREDIKSMGILSMKNANESKNEVLNKLKRRMGVLVIDEAHNYLNRKSARSIAISEHNAECIILATATPISKSINDLIRLIELLGIDNLSDKDLEEYFLMKKRHKKTDEDLKKLKLFISPFVVRIAKPLINEYIKQEPEKYTRKITLNKGSENPEIVTIKCKYPNLKEQTYEMKESVKDKTAAKEIREISKKLKGVIYLLNLKKVPALPMTEEEYILGRIKLAKGLSIYNVNVNMRSSRAALIEHILGTQAAVDEFQFKSNKIKEKKETGNICASIAQIIEDKKMPETDIPIQLFYDHDYGWLMEREAFKQVCKDEINLYQQIAEIAKKMSSAREERKAKVLIDLFKKHKLVLAFDNRIISIEYMKHLLDGKNMGIETRLLMGSTVKVKANSKEVPTILAPFQRDAKEKNILGLCSDSVSEGVNLQNASAVVMLDYSSVLRIVEQRIGRIDRIDSTHEKIEAFFPKDAEEFQLPSDGRLAETMKGSEQIMGTNNFKLPESMGGRHYEDSALADERKEILNLIKENEDKNWEGFEDRLQIVKNLCNSEKSLIPLKLYQKYKDYKADIWLKLSVTKSDKNWFFAAIAGDSKNKIPPRWYLINEDDAVVSDLKDICNCLESYLKNNKDEWFESEKIEKIKEEVPVFVKKYFKILRENEIELLPNKLKRSLKVAQELLKEFKKIPKPESQKDINVLIDQILEKFKISFDFNIETPVVNFYLFAQKWWEILSKWKKKVIEDIEKSDIEGKNKKGKIYSIKHLTAHSQAIYSYTSIEFFVDIINSIPKESSPLNNLTVCMIAIPK